MFNLLWQFTKSQTISIASKINIKDILNMTKKTVDKVSAPVKQIKKIKEELQPVKTKKEPKWQSWFPFSFCYGGGKFQPLYFMVTLFCFLAASMLYTKIHAASVAIKTNTFTPEMISTADLGVVLGFISSLILLYNNNKKNYIKEFNDDSKKDSNNQV